MSTSSISLRKPMRTAEFDEGGVAILKCILPRAVPRAPEEEAMRVDVDFVGVPSLSYFCIKHIARYYEQLPTEGIRLCYRPSGIVSDFNLLDTLAPNPRSINPRTWATLIQLYDGLPDALQQISLPLSHTAVPILQRLLDTPHFSLITVLDLCGAGLVTDESVVSLKELHTLVALDISDTTITSYAVQILAGSLSWTESKPIRRRGLWLLRVLRLRGCKEVDDSVFRYLLKFPLLSIVDLRQTRCSKMAAKKCGLKASAARELYYPSPIQSSLDILQQEFPDLYSTAKPFELHIGQIEEPTPAYITFPRSQYLPSDEAGQRITGTKGFYYANPSDSSAPSLNSAPRDGFWRRSTEYRRPSTSAAEISSRHYDAFMLFRDPPPLSALPTQPESKPVSSRGRANSMLAVPNRSGGKFADHKAKLEGLRETKRRRIGSDAMATFPVGFSTTPIGESKKRNPFRRQSVPASMEVLMKSTTKPLKPISQLPPPAFDGLLPNKPKKRTQATLDTMIKGGTKGAEEKQPPAATSRKVVKLKKGTSK